VEEELPDHSPAGHARRSRLDGESPATRLDRNELGPPPGLARLLSTPDLAARQIRAWCPLHRL